MSRLDEIMKASNARGGYITPEERYEEAFLLYGPPKHVVKPDLATIERYRGRVPDSLLRIWQDYGWGSWSNGVLWMCDPEFLRPIMHALFDGDPQFNPETVTPYVYDGFGGLHIWISDNKQFEYKVLFNSGSVDEFQSWNEEVQKSFTVSENFIYFFHTLLSKTRVFGDFLNNYKRKSMMPELIKRYGELEPGEVYGFVPALPLGGSMSINNIQRMPILSYLSFLIEFERPMYESYTPPAEGEAGYGTITPIRRLGPQE
ncbi:GAD-like domain-containing protein [Bartonella sp. HY406]|uniref:GAD-like domain-containing protein n=1 Tax=Bartonella sp. HY406 TaxID=2979331 RepID=UPI0021C7BF23|nr:GAD-like domain-containing protein [Bartonella sp. HY406]UXN02618.1 DUF1851 domain-containing protein [Bartonella sp. HY406]